LHLPVSLEFATPVSFTFFFGLLSDFSFGKIDDVFVALVDHTLKSSSLACDRTGFLKNVGDF
jgi:hypothetical protein